MKLFGMNDRARRRAEKSKRGATKMALRVISAVSGLFTYMGTDMVLAAIGLDLMARILAAAFSCGVSVMIYLFWLHALDAGDKMRTARTRGIASAIILVGCLFLVSLSSWMNVTALAGSGALESHMKKALVTSEDVVDETYRRTRLAEQLVPDLEIAATRYAGLAASERCCGTLTGVPGSGGIAGTLDNASEQLRSVIQTIRTGSQRSEGLAEKARTYLQNMRDVVNGPGPATERMKAMAAESDKLRAVLAAMSSQTLIESVGRTMSGLSTNIVQRATSTRAHIAQKQREAWVRIQEDFTKTGHNFVSAAGKIADLPQVPALVFERISVVQAVVRYAADFIPYWAGGIALDLCPALVVAFLMLGRAARDGDGPGGEGIGAGPRVPPGIGDLTVQEVIDAQKALAVLQGKEREAPAGEEDLGKMLGFDRQNKKYRH